LITPYRRVVNGEVTDEIVWMDALEEEKEYIVPAAFYNKVVFATDKNLRSYDYPIKSGYYFNPAGKYTFEVTTVNYKTGQGKTKEHEELVNVLINSFRYESNLIYIMAATRL